MFHRIFVVTAATTALATISLLAQPGPQTKPTTAPATQAAATTQPAGKETVTQSGLRIIETSPGDPAARAGDIVWVHYIGTLKDGKEFDNSRKRGEPIRFTLGKNEVIKGWDEGIAGMTVGAKRTLVIPPALGYGEKGMGASIPPNSELRFDVELIGLARPGEEPPK
jgi:peptidylprolyl isomerase